MCYRFGLKKIYGNMRSVPRWHNSVPNQSHVSRKLWVLKIEWYSDRGTWLQQLAKLGNPIPTIEKLEIPIGSIEN